ncbi:MAG: hypothetical protein ABSD58_09265 [Verrucomicrobiia bacterium]
MTASHLVNAATDLIRQRPFKSRSKIHDPVFIQKKCQAFRRGCSPQFFVEDGQIVIEEMWIPIVKGNVRMIIVGGRKFEMEAAKRYRIRADHQWHGLGAYRFSSEVANNDVERSITDFLVDDRNEPVAAPEVDSPPESGVERIGSFLDLIPNTHKRHVG